MKTRKLRELEVSAIGVGCMGMSFGYGGQDEQEAIKTIHRAVDLGVTFFDTAELYGPFTNEQLLGKAFRGLRDRVVIATKFGFRISDQGEGTARIVGVDSRPDHVKAVADASLARLGVDVIDLYYQHRVDPSVPIEDVVGAMADLVKAGKIKTIGLSEPSEQTLRRAHAVHPITAVQSEYSLWSREPEASILPTCRELGIGFVPYSPLGRGVLTGAIRSPSDLSDDDWRRGQPRFSPHALAANLALVDALAVIAKQRNVTAAQLALAWLLHRGEHIVPIPGVRRIKHLEENVAAAEISLTSEESAAIEAAMPRSAVTGARYADAELSLVNR